MNSLAKILHRYPNSIEIVGKMHAFRIPKSPEKTIISREGFSANLFATRAIYRIFRRVNHLPACFIFFLARHFDFPILPTGLKFLKAYLKAC